MIVYRILENGYFGGTEEYPDDGGIPYGTTRTEVPFIPEGSYAFWAGTGWNIIDTAPVIHQAPLVPDVEAVSIETNLDQAPVTPVPDVIPTETNLDQLTFDQIFYEEPLIGEYNEA